MSIIEEAVRKNAERQNRQSSTDPLRGQARLRRVPATPVDTSHAQRFQPITLDKAALHDNFILPQLQDAGALRAYKILRTRVLRRLEANQWHSFAITGVTAGEGKTLTAVNLAIALAQDVNTWVALVDLDLQRPRVAEYLGMRSTPRRKRSERLSAGQRDLREHHVFAGYRAARGDSELPADDECFRAADLAAHDGADAGAGRRKRRAAS